MSVNFERGLFQQHKGHDRGVAKTSFFTTSYVPPTINSKTRNQRPLPQNSIANRLMETTSSVLLHGSLDTNPNHLNGQHEEENYILPSFFEKSKALAKIREFKKHGYATTENDENTKKLLMRSTMYDNIDSIFTLRKGSYETTYVRFVNNSHYWNINRFPKLLEGINYYN